jgi:hypothetical protein
MANFLIWGRVEQMATGEYVAIATALRADGSSEELEVVPHVNCSRSDAEGHLRLALVALGERVRARGHTIVDVETDGV